MRKRSVEPVDPKMICRVWLTVKAKDGGTAPPPPELASKSHFFEANLLYIAAIEQFFGHIRLKRNSRTKRIGISRYGGKKKDKKKEG